MKSRVHISADGTEIQNGTSGPSAELLARSDLPPPNTKRWVSRRKAEVVAGVRSGLITLENALEIYNLSLDEYRSWERLLTEYGLEGLRTTRIKKYRDHKRRSNQTPQRIHQ